MEMGLCILPSRGAPADHGVPCRQCYVCFEVVAKRRWPFLIGRAHVSAVLNVAWAASAGKGCSAVCSPFGLFSSDSSGEMEARVIGKPQEACTTSC